MKVPNATINIEAAIWKVIPEKLENIPSKKTTRKEINCFFARSLCNATHSIAVIFSDVSKFSIKSPNRFAALCSYKQVFSVCGILVLTKSMRQLKPILIKQL